ncbi:MAG TPA: UdgX family uracil-DNA binding protein [Thermoanaerobaculia bacterium]|jgi:DNA polymerase
MGRGASTSRDDASPFVPPSRDLRVLKRASRECRGCPLYRPATQTVFGSGPARAPILLIGEQPGDQEDLQGTPFVGPAGRVLDEALAKAGLSRRDVFLTNAVKHFKFEPRGKKRIHQKPNAAELEACRPWLFAELEAVRPRVIVSLGATAERSLSRIPPTGAGAGVRIATIHPSAALRAPEREARHRLRARLARDLRRAHRASLAKTAAPARDA